MKRKFYRSCVSLLLSMVLIFGGVHIGAGGAKPNLPPIISTLISVDIATPVTTNIGVGNTLQLTCTTDPGGCPITWSSSNQSVATISSSGLVTGVSAGSTTITVTAYDPIVSSFYLTDSITITVHKSVGICNNAEYYIMNVSDDCYMGLQTSSDSDLTAIHTSADRDHTRYQWRVELQSDGTMQLINTYSITEKCLSMNYNDACIKTDSGDSTQKFTIERVETGEYAGLYLIKYGTMYIAPNNNGIVRATAQPSEKCYWSFMKVDKGNGLIFSFDYPGFDTTANDQYFVEVLSSLGYLPLNSPNDYAHEAYAALSTNDVFVFRGHGNAGILAFYDEDGVTNGAICVNSTVARAYEEATTNSRYLENLNSNELSQLRVALYIGCSTGVDFGSVNLLDATFEKGAHFVLGTSETVYTPDSNAFLVGFLDDLEGAQSNIWYCIESGIITAGAVESSTGSYPVVFIGDSNQYLN